MSALEAATASIVAQFEYKNEDVLKGITEFIKEMKLGLAEQTLTMCQIPTYITRIANGLERGLALAVDLGGTNLRVCSVDLQGDTTYNAKHTRTAIPQEIMLASHSSILFSFIATQLKSFLHACHPECLEEQNTSVFRLGFTFSFPVHQTSINSGKLLRWTKGFDIADAVGKDVCQLLQSAIDNLKLPVIVTALVNDAAGTIMSRAYSLPLSSPRTSIGTIFSTGTNCVYLEKISNITKTLEGEYDKITGEMLISVEWGSFDNKLSVLPTTVFDIVLDEGSFNIGNQMFEKRVSGMYLGELLRLALVSLHSNINKKAKLFSSSKEEEKQDAVSSEEEYFEGLHKKWAVDSSILSIAEADNSESLETLRKGIEEVFNIPPSRISLEDMRAVKAIAHAIGKRAARLAGMSTAAVILQSSQLTIVPLDTEEEIAIKLEGLKTAESERENVVVDIGVDGSVIQFYPGFESYMRETFRTIPGIGEAEKKIKLGIAKDGSSVGAAIIALLAA